MGESAGDEGCVWGSDYVLDCAGNGDFGSALNLSLCISDPSLVDCYSCRN